MQLAALCGGIVSGIMIARDSRGGLFLNVLVDSRSFVGTDDELASGFDGRPGCENEVAHWLRRPDSWLGILPDAQHTGGFRICRIQTGFDAVTQIVRPDNLS